MLALGEVTCRALFIDLDTEQVNAGSVPRVAQALLRAEVSFLAEASSSGNGIHFWVILPEWVAAVQAVAWMDGLLGRAGLRRKSRGQPGDYDEIKPTGGDGGIVIVPHFFADGRSSLARIVEAGWEVLAPDEAEAAIEGYKQRASVVEEIQATPVSIETGTRGARSKSSGNASKEEVNDLPLPDLRQITPEEEEREGRLLQMVVDNNDQLSIKVKEAFAEEEAGKSRSESMFYVLCSLLIDHQFHPKTVVKYFEQSQRGRKTSLWREVSRVYQKTQTFVLTDGGGYWKSNIIVHPSKDREHILLQETVVDVTRSQPVSEGGADTEQEQMQPPNLPRVRVFDIPMGGGKSTEIIPEVTFRLVA